MTIENTDLREVNKTLRRLCHVLEAGFNLQLTETGYVKKDTKEEKQ